MSAKRIHIFAESDASFTLFKQSLARSRSLKNRAKVSRLHHLREAKRYTPGEPLLLVGEYWKHPQWPSLAQMIYTASAGRMVGLEWFPNIPGNSDEDFGIIVKP